MEDTIRRIDDNGLDILFRTARTFYAWQDKPVTDEQLHELYDLLKLGPTSANTSPLRVLFLRSDGAKARLLPTLSPTNVEKSRTAPVVALVSYDVEFYERMPFLFPHVPDARNWFAGKPEFIEEAAFRNSSLQGAYLILAARALGLDCGPMSGFDTARLNDEFFPDGKWKINFVCNLGYGDPVNQFGRLPRLPFDDACKVL
ncbi:MAG: malonic semialdehyde reductase [Fimbriimonas sp.]|nr:malonic semialdehyde reductase [Fimbriimonas sp.]